MMKPIVKIMGWAMAGILFSFLIVACQKENALVTNADNNEVLSLRGNENFPKSLLLPNGFHPEGIAVGKGTDFYVSSLNQGGIYKGDLRTGEGSMLVPNWPCLYRMGIGLSFDDRSDLLFNAGGFYGNARVFDTDNGDMLAQFQFRPPFSGTMINDVVVTRKAAWFTDCLRPYLYKVPLGPAGQLPDPLSFEAVFLSGDFVQITEPEEDPPFNVNGIDATPNGKYLVIGTWVPGTLYRVDAATGEALLIDVGGTLFPWGDGILLDGFTLYIVQGYFNRIAVVELSPDLLSGEVVEYITDPEFKIPSTIAEFGSSLYAVNARFDVAPPGQCLPDVEFDVLRVDK